MYMFTFHEFYFLSKFIKILKIYICILQGDYVHAEERFQRAMEIRRRHPNKRDYFMALLCQSYGWNLGSQGKFVQALRYESGN